METATRRTAPSVLISTADITLMWAPADLPPELYRIIGVIAAAIAIISALLRLVRYIADRRHDQSLAKRLAGDRYTEAEIKKSIVAKRAYYVRPDGQDNDPATGSKPINRRPLFDEIDRLLGAARVRFTLLLADSGMGKSSLLEQYYLYHWASPKRSARCKLVLVRLNQLDADALVNAIALPERSETVLLLDAFDEDAVANTDACARFVELVQLTGKFRAVFVTCRTQFLPEGFGSTPIPQEITTPSSAGSAGLGDGPDRAIHLIYLSPLSDLQIKKNLAARYPYWRHPFLRHHSVRTALRYSDLVSRPLLLAYIRDLATSRENLKYRYQVYEIIIAGWLHREANKRCAVSDQDEFRRFLERLAGELFGQGRDRLSTRELDRLARQYSVRMDPREVRERSLLHHDSAGNWKFAHRSMMEYLLVKASITATTDQLAWAGKPWTQQMREFAREMLVSGVCKQTGRARLNGLDLSGVNLRDVDLSATDLRETDLRGADLGHSRGLTVHQAIAATGNLRTIWPSFTLKGHCFGVLNCVISPDGDYVVSASRDKSVKVWDVRSGRERFSLPGHAAAMHTIAISPQSDYFVAATDDFQLKVWDATTGKERFALGRTSGWALGGVICPKGDLIGPVSCGGDSRTFWDATTGRERFTIAQERGMGLGCAISSEGDFVVCAVGDIAFGVWDASTGEKRLSFTGHSSFVKGCAISPNGDFVVSGEEDETVKVWEPFTGRERFTSPGHMSACAISPGSDFLVCALNDTTLKILDSVTGVERATLVGHSRPVTSCAISPTGTFIVSGSSDCTVKVWDATSGENRLTLAGHTGPVTRCAIGPKGDFIVSASEDESLRIWFPPTTT